MFTTVLLLGLWKRLTKVLPAALSINVLCLHDKYVQIVFFFVYLNMLQRLDKCLFFQKLVYLHTQGKDDLFLTNAYRVLTG